MVSLAFITSAYLLGSIPQVYWLIRLKGGDPRSGDLHEYLWGLSHKLGATGFVIDMAKGAIVILTGKWLNYSIELIAIAGLLVIVGQMWPVYLPRSGGGGNTVAITVSATLAIYPFLLAMIAVLTGLAWRIVTHIRNGQPALGPPHSRSLPLSVFIAMLIMPVSNWLLKMPDTITYALAGLFVIITARRLIKGLMEDSRDQAVTAKLFFKRLIFD